MGVGPDRGPCIWESMADTENGWETYLQLPSFLLEAMVQQQYALLGFYNLGVEQNNFNQH